GGAYRPVDEERGLRRGRHRRGARARSKGDRDGSGRCGDETERQSNSRMRPHLDPPISERRGALGQQPVWPLGSRIISCYPRQMPSSGAPPHADPLAAMTPVLSRSAPAQIADQLVLAVREHRLMPGDRLPSERELAERFGVSRPTIREALTSL